MHRLQPGRWQTVNVWACERCVTRNGNAARMALSAFGMRSSILCAKHRKWNQHGNDRPYSNGVVLLGERRHKQRIHVRAKELCASEATQRAANALRLAHTVCEPSKQTSARRRMMPLVDGADGVGPRAPWVTKPLLTRRYTQLACRRLSCCATQTVSRSLPSVMIR